MNEAIDDRYRGAYDRTKAPDTGDRLWSSTRLPEVTQRCGSPAIGGGARLLSEHRRRLLVADRPGASTFAHGAREDYGATLSDLSRS